jgi:hypothetical protein
VDGLQTHQHAFIWIAMINAKLGEASATLLEDGPRSTALRQALVEVAAVAVAAIEALDAQARTGYWGDSI